MTFRGRVLNFGLGIVLFSVGAYFLIHLTTLWKFSWKEAQAASPAPKAAKAGDDPTDAAKLEMYGVLASQLNQDGAAQSEPEKPRAIPPSAPIDHMAPAPGESRHFLHKTFSVQNYEGFEFIVPAHAFEPRVSGSFKAAAPMDVLLLNQQQLDYFLKGYPGSVTYSLEGQAAGEVEWVLNSPMSEPARYYLIFRSTAAAHGRRVAADFTFSSE